MEIVTIVCLLTPFETSLQSYASTLTFTCIRTKLCTIEVGNVRKFFILFAAFRACTFCRARFLDRLAVIVWARRSIVTRFSNVVDLVYLFVSAGVVALLFFPFPKTIKFTGGLTQLLALVAVLLANTAPTLRLIIWGPVHSLRYVAPERGPRPLARNAGWLIAARDLSYLLVLCIALLSCFRHDKLFFDGL